MSLTATTRGIPDLKAALADLAPQLRRRALRNALAAGARVVRDEIKRHPALADSSQPGMLRAVRRGVRRHGTVRDAVRVRTSKLARRAGDIGVFVNVRPLKGSRGTDNPADPYYWRWLEYGWRPASKRGGGVRVSGRKFIESGAGKLDAALQVFTARIGPEIQRLNVRRGAA